MTPPDCAHQPRVALFQAASANDIRGVRLAIERGASIDARGQYGRTACMQGALQADSDCIAIIIAAGADMDLLDVAGISALMISCANARTATAHALIDAGADTDLRCCIGKRALDYVADGISYLNLEDATRSGMQALQERLQSLDERKILGQCQSGDAPSRRLTPL